MMRTLAQTGNGWMTFKDKCNRASNQTLRAHNVIHLSNLCTEILEVTSAEETAVCNLGSINLARHVDAELGFDFDKLAETVRLAVRQLDRVIDLNFYPIETARRGNLRWRPVGLGCMVDGDDGARVLRERRVRKVRVPAVVRTLRNPRGVGEAANEDRHRDGERKRCPAPSKSQPGHRSSSSRGVVEGTNDGHAGLTVPIRKDRRTPAAARLPVPGGSAWWASRRRIPSTHHRRR